MNYLKQTLSDAKIIELRHLYKRDGYAVVRSGLFDDIEPLQKDIRQLSEYGNLYTTLNRPTATATNELVKGKSITDADINIITRLPFDFDPVRATGTASTDEQLQLARKSMQRFMRFLCVLGWPTPLIALSGNGYHLQYRTAMPADADTKKMLSILYKALRQDFGTELVDFDSTVRNPSRIFRLYGTINRKGNDESLWRQSTCVIPPGWGQVPPKLIKKLSDRYKPVPVAKPRREVSNRHYSSDMDNLDVVAWFTAHGLYKHHIEDHKHAVTCPWSYEHSEASYNDSIIFETDGSWPGFHCKHSHCDGRNIKDVMQLLGDASAYCKAVLS